tara:strand:- start:38 stop:259 length:222 start_codon:yes stop_codon:yes gene_type:complete
MSEEIKNNRKLLLQLSSDLHSISKNIDSTRQELSIIKILMKEIKSDLVKLNYNESRLQRGENIEKSTGWYFWS